MKVNKIGESKFEHEAAGFSAQAVGSLFICLFFYNHGQLLFYDQNGFGWGVLFNVPHNETLEE